MENHHPLWVNQLPLGQVQQLFGLPKGVEYEIAGTFWQTNMAMESHHD